MACQGGHLIDCAVLPVGFARPDVYLVEAVAVGGDHLVGDFGENEVADLGT